MKESAFLLLPFWLLTLSACAVGPDFEPPSAPTDAAYLARTLPEKTGATAVHGGEAQRFQSGGVLSSRWWELFGSVKLNELIERALQGSPTLASAQAALRRAEENMSAQHASLFPAADGVATATRQKVDSASFGDPQGGVQVYNLYNTSVEVSYGLDLFGAARRALEAEAAQLEYQQFQLEGTYQTLVANIVTSAVQEARLRTLVRGRKMTLENLEGLLKIAEKQVELGAVGQADVLLARSNLATEQATLPVLERQLSQAQHQLAVYLGQLPGQRVATDFELTDFKLPTDLPLSLPSDLVRQRPDIRAAEALLHRASAEVGIATAHQFPQLRLSGSYGSQSSSGDGLFAAGIWSLGANLTHPLFRAGQLNARRRAALAAYEGAEAEYQQAVLRAFQNVADCLRALETDAQALQAQLTAAEAADAALALIEKQYELGAASYVEVLAAQRQRTLAKAGLVQTLADRYQNTAALLLALGGGWWNREPAP